MHLESPEPSVTALLKFTRPQVCAVNDRLLFLAFNAKRLCGRTRLSRVARLGLMSAQAALTTVLSSLVKKFSFQQGTAPQQCWHVCPVSVPLRGQTLRSSL